MYCPEHLVFKSRFLWVWMYWRDVPRKRIPKKVWLNPLRYEICINGSRGRLFTFNREGRWARIASNKLFAMRERLSAKEPK